MADTSAVQEDAIAAERRHIQARILHSLGSGEFAAQQRGRLRKRRWVIAEAFVVERAYHAGGFPLRSILQARLPSSAGRDKLRCAIGISKLEHCGESGGHRLGDRLLRREDSRRRHGDANLNGIRARGQFVPDIFTVEFIPGFFRSALAPVHLGVEISSRHHVKDGVLRFGGKLQLETKIGNGLWQSGKRILAGNPDPSNVGEVRLSMRIVPTDPFGGPVCRLQETHFPPRRLVGLRGAAALVPYANGPIVAMTRLKRRPGVGNANRFRRTLFTAIPDVWFGGPKRVRGACHQDLVGSLAPIALGVIALPGEIRLQGIDTERVLQIFAPEVDGPGVGGGSSEHQQGESLHPFIQALDKRSSAIYFGGGPSGLGAQPSTSRVSEMAAIFHPAAVLSRLKESTPQWVNFPFRWKSYSAQNTAIGPCSSSVGFQVRSSQASLLAPSCATHFSYGMATGAPLGCTEKSIASGVNSCRAAFASWADMASKSRWTVWLGLWPLDGPAPAKSTHIESRSNGGACIEIVYRVNETQPRSADAGCSFRLADHAADPRH